MSKDEKYDYLEYADQLTEEELEWRKKFNDEYYFDGISSTNPEKRIIQSEEMTQEARRNHNSMKTDTLFRAKSDGMLADIHENSVAFMEEASDEWQWQDAYKIGGFELAIKTILEQTLRDLDNEKIDRTTTLLRYYEKRDRLRRVYLREKRK